MVRLAALEQVVKAVAVAVEQMQQLMDVNEAVALEDVVAVAAMAAMAGDRRLEYITMVALL